MNRMTDDVLVTALKKNDRSLKKSFIDQYQSSSVRFATALTGDCNAAEEITRKALRCAMERIDSFKEGQAFRPWFLKIVEDLARDHMRRKARQKAREAWNAQNQDRLTAPRASAETKEGFSSKFRRNIGAFKAIIVAGIAFLAAGWISTSISFSGLPEYSEKTWESKRSKIYGGGGSDSEHKFYNWREGEESRAYGLAQSLFNNSESQKTMGASDIEAKRLEALAEDSIVSQQRMIKAVQLRVTDENRSPISGVSIFVLRVPKSKVQFPFKFGETIANPTTDGHGRIHIQIEKGKQSFGPEEVIMLYSYLWTKHRKAAPASAAREGVLDMGDYVFDRQDYCSLTASVEHSGRPLFGALIKLYRCDKPYDHEKPWTYHEWYKTGSTDKQGRYTWLQDLHSPAFRQFRVHVLVDNVLRFDRVVRFRRGHKELLIRLK